MNEIPEVIKSGLKRTRRNYLILMALLLLVAAALLMVGVSIQNKLKTAPMHFLDFLISENQKEMTYVYVDILDDPWEVAYRTEDKRVIARYYFLWDGEYIYLAKLTDGEVQSLIGDLDAGRTTRVDGFTRKIPNDLKKICIEVFEDEFGIILNESTLEDYLGLYLVDPSYKTSESSYYFFASGSFVVFALLAVVNIMVKSRRFKTTLENRSHDEWQHIAYEYSSGYYYASLNKNRLVLTENFIINLLGVPDIIRYSDVVWVFGSVVRNTGVPIATGISVYTRDAKEHMLPTATGATKGQTNQRDEFMYKIMERCPNALAGYSNEARAAAKEYYGINR